MIELKNICKVFKECNILWDFNICVDKGEFISITGESGKGKTTLLNIMSLLEKPTKGEVIVNGISNPSKKEILKFQRYSFAYLFQNYALIESETVEKNLKIALAYRKVADSKKEISDVLKSVGLVNYEKKKIYELSGGEQQRVAMARVILKDAEYIFADEPTGNLDIENRNIIFDLLQKLNEEGRTVVFVTHDLELASKAKIHIDL